MPLFPQGPHKHHPVHEKQTEWTVKWKNLSLNRIYKKMSPCYLDVQDSLPCIIFLSYVLTQRKHKEKTLTDYDQGVAPLCFLTIH